MPTMQIHGSEQLAKLSEAKGAESSKTPLCFDHLNRMLTNIGIWQHSEGDIPNKRHGYSIDDEARGLIVGLKHWEQRTLPKFNKYLASICFDFLVKGSDVCQEWTGCFHNFCDADGKWLDTIGSDDSFGRTIWGLGVAHSVNAPFIDQKKVGTLLHQSLPHCDELSYLRSKAFVILGLAPSRFDDERLMQLANDLADAYEATADAEWHWFENHMTYCNARLPQAMLAAAELFPDNPRYRKIGEESLDFLLAITRQGKNGYAPIGNAPLTTKGWFNRGDLHPPLFDQQPVDAGALVEACVQAYHVTGEPRFRIAASEAFAWYLGDNVHGIPVYNCATGGVADAITPTGINRNQGAESVLSFHLAYLALQKLD